MISDTAVVLGTDLDPRFTLRVGASMIHASKDNMDKVMTDLEQSRKSSAQLKDSLRKEREDNNKIKRKYQELKEEMRVSEPELQALQLDKQVRETMQECLEQV